MPATTKISWADASINWWKVCHQVSKVCNKCYSARIDGWKSGDPLRVSQSDWEEPLSWSPRVIFAESMSDFFLPAADHLRPMAWDVIRRGAKHDWLILSKWLYQRVHQGEDWRTLFPNDWEDGWDHVWLGASTGLQADANRWLPILAKEVKAKHKFLSCEPLLEELNIWWYLGPDQMPNRISWVITGGESDYTDPRPMKPEWALGIRQQALNAGALHFHKQNGGSKRIDGEFGGYKIDGEVYRDMPDFPSRRDPQMRLF